MLEVRRSRAKRNAKSGKQQEALLSLLQATKSDLHRVHTGGKALTAMHGEPLPPEGGGEKLQVKHSEYFLLRFYEHCSYVPKSTVDLTGWHPELTPEVKVFSCASS